MKKRILKVISGILAAAVFTVSAAGSLLAQPGTVPDWSTLSAWAESDIKEAYELGILQPDMARDFQTEFTREQFCDACVEVLSLWQGCDFRDTENVPELKAIADKADFQGFSDTSVWYVEFCAKLGIVNGMGDGTFAPDSSITREQAARMLYNTLSVGTDIITEAEADNENGVNGIFLPHVFTDGREIDSWARSEIYTAYNLGIMTGDTENNFDPLGTYTREQAYCTFLRLYKAEASPEEINAPEAALYPSADNKIYYRPSEDYYYLNDPYNWYSEESSYEPVYYDGFGNTYTADEKGYVYPMGNDYMEVLVSQGVGSTESVIIDKNKNEVTDTYSVIRSLKGSTAVVEDYDKIRELNLDTGEVREVNALETDMGCGMTRFADSETNLTGCYNSESKAVIPSVYNLIMRQQFLNSLCVFQKQDNSFVILNTEGEVLKSFTLDLDKYYVDSIFGTNMILGTNSEPVNYVLYRAYSEEYIADGYTDMSFNSIGGVIAHKSHDMSIYLYDKEGKLIKDVSSMGYNEIKEEKTGGYYQVFRIDSSNYSRIMPYDIMDYDGNIIKTGVTNYSLTLNADGITAYQDGNTIRLFDAEGSDLGEVTVDDDITRFGFIEGLLNIQTKGGCYYYTPDGKEAVKTAWVIYN